MLAGKKRPPIVLNHRRQADNALRLGVIDRNRYGEILKRLALYEATQETHEERLGQLLAGGGFLRDLPTDCDAKGKTPRSRFVPEPGYYVTRIPELTDDQQGEYLIAFCDRTTLPLVRKYTFVRLTSLLESVLFYPSQVDDAAAEKEARHIASLNEGSGAFYASEVSKVIACLCQQHLTERQTRAQLLRDIDHRTVARMAGAGLTLAIGGGSPLGMPLSADYFKAIRLPIDDLRIMQRTGRAPESDQDRRDREAWSRDIEALRAPEVETARNAAFAAMEVAMADPVAAFQQFTSYCNLLLTLGKSMVHVQELQLGYRVDRLTATLVRLKRWREALDWLERYFALPKRYRDRSSPSEGARLQKRLARCAGMIHEDSSPR